ncbi:MAG: general secretion pathway protein GspK [Candidatus Omnitrophica bacterium]|nr:general secretion pathway protein GspK [Candidatus Omnitrophota bacterium]
MKEQSSKNGIALVLVVSILTVVAIIVVSFIFTMRMESRAAVNYLWQEKARYIAEAGIAHARAVLKEDKGNNFLDSYDDPWRSIFTGGNIDNNEDGGKDSRWIEMTVGGEVIGRYAVLIEDEAAKANINVCGFHNESPIKAIQGATTFEVSLKDFLNAKAISQAQGIANAIIAYRYGQDLAPGEKAKDDNLNQYFLDYDGVDNNANGDIDEPAEGVDEPGEFVVQHPYGDDRPFLTTAQIKNIPEMSENIYRKIKSEITAYSETPSTNRNGDFQWDINHIDAQQLLDVLLRSGVANPWQKAVNLVDFTDTDFSQSVAMKSSSVLYTQDQGAKGDWQWVGEHYESKTFGGLKGTWTWSDIPAGEYFLILHGSDSDQYIGDVTVGSLTQTHMSSGETFNLFPSGTIQINDLGAGSGVLTIAIQNNEGLGTTCYFKYIELVSASFGMLGEAQEVRGVEGIRINEIMVAPKINLTTTISQSPGGDWVWQGDHYENAASAGGPAGAGTWLWSNLPDGEYYLTLFAENSTQMVGDVIISGLTQENMRSGERFTKRQTVSVSNGIFRLDIQNNLSSGSCYFKSIVLSQQPDAEYVELVNLTPQEVSLGGYSLETSATDGWPASIPLGTTIGAGDYLVLAVDKEDSCSGLSGNGISFQDVWGSLNSCQLDFSRSVTINSDLIEDQPLSGEGQLILRDARGYIVDMQKYSAGQVSPYISLEKGDPTYVDEVDKIWFASADLSGATAGKKNNNSSIIEIQGQEVIEHDLSEVQVNNHALANLGEISKAVSGEPWKKIGSDDLMNVADRLSVYSLRLEAEGHKTLGGWTEKLRPLPGGAWFESNTAGEVGTFLWEGPERIPSGVYFLYLYGKSEEALCVSLHLADGSWTPFTPALVPAANNAICFGRVEIGTGNPGALADQKIELRLKNSSDNNLAHFDYIVLAPLPYVPGKININTASLDVLKALPKIDETCAQRIMSARPLGNQGDQGRGIGDILAGNVLDSDPDEKLAKFSAISNLITVRSDTYQIVATAQALDNGRVMAEKRIRAVIER